VTQVSCSPFRVSRLSVLQQHRQELRNLTKCRMATPSFRSEKFLAKMFRFDIRAFARAALTVPALYRSQKPRYTPSFLTDYMLKTGVDFHSCFWLFSTIGVRFFSRKLHQNDKQGTFWLIKFFLCHSECKRGISSPQLLTKNPLK